MEQNIQLKPPPEYLDDAKVVKWAWSGEKPFGFVGEEAIYGLAICQYSGSNSVYRFSCDKDWVTIQDAQHDSIEQAINHLPEQYKNVFAEWH